MLDLVVFGRIAVGKSALLNAVFGEGAFVVDVLGGTTREVDARVVDFYGVEVRIMDTPGIGEVSGADRAAAACAAARGADIVLAVFDHEPTDFEYDAVLALAKVGKPMLVILNKADALAARDRNKLHQRVQSRVGEFVDPSNVLVCAADPIKHFVQEWPDGRTAEWSERSAPDVSRVRERLRDVLRDEGHLLEQLDSLSREAEDRQLLRVTRDARADELIEKYAAGMAAGLALNPIPLVDFFAGGAAIVALVHQLATNYDVEVSQQEVRELAQSLVVQGWKPLWPAVLPLVAGSLLKGIPVLGWFLSAVSLGVGGFYLTHILGQACKEYFAHDKQWSVSLQATLDEIIAQTDRESISHRAAKLIKERLA